MQVNLSYFYDVKNLDKLISIFIQIYLGGFRKYRPIKNSEQL